MPIWNQRYFAWDAVGGEGPVACSVGRPGDGIVRTVHVNREPVLLRRDVNTTDGDVAGVHFCSLQREIDEFRRVREAMAGEEFGQYGLGPRGNNGVFQYLRLRRWGSYLVPPRRLPDPPPQPGCFFTG